MKLLLQIALVPLLAMAVTQQTSARNLSVAIYQGPWGEAIKGCIVEPFVQATHIKVTPEPGMSVETLEKLRAQRRNPKIDVAWMDGGVSELAAADGLVSPIRAAAVPHIADLIPQGVHKTSRSVPYALSTGFVAFGLVYDRQKFGVPPTSWWDLWKPEFAGRSSLPSPAHPMGVPLMLQLNTLLGGAPTNLDPVIRKYAQLPASAFAGTLAGSIGDLRSGKASIAAQYASIAWSLADSGLPIGYAAPREGALASDIRLHIVRGSRNVAQARRFVNFAIADEQASCMAERMYLVPANRGVVLSERAKARMPWGRDGSIADLVMIDWEQVHAAQQTATAAWTSEIGGGKP
jgi:putative spermidine/putrescine transport system substrate-binding protein